MLNKYYDINGNEIPNKFDGNWQKIHYLLEANRYLDDISIRLDKKHGKSKRSYDYIRITKFEAFDNTIDLLNRDTGDWYMNLDMVNLAVHVQKLEIPQTIKDALFESFKMLI